MCLNIIQELTANSIVKLSNAATRYEPAALDTTVQALKPPSAKLQQQPEAATCLFML